MTAKLLNDTAVMEPLDQLLLHPRNPNRADIDEIERSIRKVGWYGVLIVQRSTRYILKGNHSAQAARRAGLTQVPVFWVDVDDATALTILVGDNEYAAHGVRDKQAVLDILALLRQSSGLEGTGFTESSYADLLAEVQGQVRVPLLADEDDVPPLQQRIISAPGELWQIGPHRLLIGDSRQERDLARLCDGTRVHLMLTDPPYNVNYTGKTREAMRIDNDAMTPEEFQAFLNQAMQAASAQMKPGAVYYVFYAEVEVEAFRSSTRRAGLRYSQTLVWVKNAANLSRQDYNWRHEPALYGWKEGAAHYYCRDFTQTSVWDDSTDLTKLTREELIHLLQLTRDQSTVIYADKPLRNDLHPTMKPVSVFRPLIENSTIPGQIVLDPFAGSGTALIAAHNTGRIAYLNELSPRYADRIIRRAAELTGLEAVREDGVGFAALEHS